MGTLTGYIKGIVYRPTITPALPTYPLDDFDINSAAPSGIIALDNGDSLGYSKWKTPKRTRTYPFARVYNTYHLNTKRVTIIPIIKDEGADTSNNDRINFITYSWMNLLNIYIVLAWHNDATTRRGDLGRVTNQRLETDFVRAKLEEITTYHASALHWNKMHFERDFDFVYRQAVSEYARLAAEKGLRLHGAAQHLAVLDTYLEQGRFSVEAFKAHSLPRSSGAAQREIVTRHQHEHLTEGEKTLFTIFNYLGGEYHLTVDELFYEEDRIILQESKNGRGRLPSLDDIKDALFKHILFLNIDALQMDGTPIAHALRLKLTGRLTGGLRLPADHEHIDAFCGQNRLSARQTALIHALQREATANPGLNIQIGDSL